MNSKPLIKQFTGIFLLSLVPIIVKLFPLDAFNLSFFRTLFASASIFVYIKFIKKSNLSKPGIKWHYLLLFGSFHALTILTYFWSLKLVGVAVSTLLLFCSVIYTPILSFIIFKEKPSLLFWISIMLALSGLILTLFSEFKVNVDYLGFFLGLLSGLFMAFIFIMAKMLTKLYDVFTMAFYQNMFATIILVLPLPFYSINLKLSAVFVYLALGVVCTAVAHILIYAALKDLSAFRVNLNMIAQIFFPLVLSAIILGEHLDFNKVAGIIIFVVSTIMVK